ncbi:OLC1v1009055C1 [Oldenlandia corymbosa var. corymbosa]|uniref:OLC1v1009055C1 n=1 Tax=Oldenlandia corymbosa var. corymbosa TaxID=529605 RepID=A0AAV1DNK8_OLDCO|nr:OLC1v1009055C1 [Oldenlandia corymbosa var. corymbosa]
MTETNQTAIPVVEPKGSVATVNDAVDNPIVIPSEDVILIPPNQTKMPVVEPSHTVETVNENAVDNSVVNPSKDVIATPPNNVGATVLKVMTLWEVPEVSKKNKVKSIEMCLIDAQGSKIQATIPGRTVKDFANSFKEGCVRRLSRFDSCLNISGGFRCAKHEYKIVFMSNTNVETTFDFDIPDQVFEFTPLAKVTNFVANFDYCVGHIMAYSDPIIENGKKRISVELEDVRSSANEMKAASIHKISMLSFISGYTSYEDSINGAKLLSLGDIDDLDEAGYVVIFGKITGLAKEYEWSYIGCRDCNKKVEEIEKEKGRCILPSAKGRNTSDNKKFGLEKKWFYGNHGPMSAVGPKFKLQVYAMDATGSRILTLWDRMMYNFIYKTAEKLREQAGKDYPKILDEIVGKKCLFRLDISKYNIRNSSSEISVARLTTDAEMIKKYIDDVFEDQTAVSCTGDTEIGNLGDDMADSPPPKTKVQEVAVKRVSNPIPTNIIPEFYSNLLMEDHVVNNEDSSYWSIDYGDYTCTIDITYMEGDDDNRIVLTGTEWKKLLEDHHDKLQECELTVLKYDGNMRFTMHFFKANGVEIEDPITIIEEYRFKIEIGDNHCKKRAITVPVHFYRRHKKTVFKRTAVIHTTAGPYTMKFQKSYDQRYIGKRVCQLKISEEWMQLLNENSIASGSQCECHLDKDSVQPRKNDIDFQFTLCNKSFKNVTFLVLMPSNQTTAKSVDLKRNQWEFMIMKENNEPVGEVDTADYLCRNGDQNTFSAVKTETVIQYSGLDITWHIVRRFKLDDYTNAILYYDGVPVINMHRIVTNDNPHRFVIEGDTKYTMDLKKIPLENIIMSRRKIKQTVVIPTVQINDAVTAKNARFTRKQFLKGQLDGGMHSDTVQLSMHSIRTNKKLKHEYHDLGDPIYVCEFCGANMWYEGKIFFQSLRNTLWARTPTLCVTNLRLCGIKNAYENRKNEEGKEVQRVVDLPSEEARSPATGSNSSGKCSIATKNVRNPNLNGSIVSNPVNYLEHLSKNRVMEVGECSESVGLEDRFKNLGKMGTEENNVWKNLDLNKFKGEEKKLDFIEPTICRVPKQTSWLQKEDVTTEKKAAVEEKSMRKTETNERKGEVQVTSQGILETKLNGEKVEELMQRKLAGYGYVSNHNGTKKGRILVVWRKQEFQVTIVRVQKQWIQCLVKAGNFQECEITVVYAEHMPRGRKELWKEIKDLQKIEVVQKEWSMIVEGSKKFKVVTKQKKLKKGLKELNQKFFAKIEEQVQEIKLQLDTVQEKMVKDPNNNSYQQMGKELTTAYIEKSKAAISMWNQKLKERWNHEGHYNSKYFHSSIKQKHAHSRIRSFIDCNGLLVEEWDRVEQHFLDYYVNLLGKMQGENLS